MQILIFFTMMTMVAIATYGICRKNHDHSDQRDFFLAGGSLHWFFIAGSLILTNISTEQIVGLNGPQRMTMVWWELSAIFGLFILSRVFLPRFYRYRCITTTEFLAKAFSDNGIKTMVSSVYLLGYIFILLPVILCTGSLFMQTVFQIHQPLIGIAGFIAFVGCLYAVAGGLRAIAVSDSLNGIGLFVGGGLLTFLGFRAIGFDLSGIPAERLTLFGATDSPLPWQTLFSGVPCIATFYWANNMVIVQRTLAAKDLSTARKGIHLAMFLKLVLPLIIGIPGIIAFKLYGVLGDATYGTFVNELLPEGFLGGFAAIMAGSILSSFNSALNSAATLYTCDIHVPLFPHHHQVKRISLIFSIIISCFSLSMVPVLASSDSIFQLMIQLNGFYAIPSFTVFCLALHHHRVSAKAAKSAFVVGILLHGIFTFLWTPLHFLHLMGITFLVSYLFGFFYDKLFYTGQRAEFMG